LARLLSLRVSEVLLAAEIPLGSVAIFQPCLTCLSTDAIRLKTPVARLNEFAMGLRPTHGDERALLRFINASPGFRVTAGLPCASKITEPSWIYTISLPDCVCLPLSAPGGRIRCTTLLSPACRGRIHGGGERRRIVMASYRLTAGSEFLLAARCVVASCLAICCFAYGQVAYPEKEVRDHDLPSLTARSTHSSDALATSLEIVFNDKEVCCGKNSALEDSVQTSDPKSLKDITNRLQGRHLLSDGRPIMVTAEYLTPDQVNAGHLIYMLTEKHAPLMMWNLHLYVVEGVTYVETVDSSTGAIAYAIHKFLLQDARFSDSRREVSFDRTTEDASKVQGLLFLQAAPK
jgi:hypothetical protein